MKYFKKVGGLIFATLLLAGIIFISPDSVEAQRRHRRVVVVRPNPYRIYRPWGWGYNGWGFNGWRYDPWSPYGSYYSQYVFDNSDDAVKEGYKDGFKTGKDDGKKNKSYNPQRSHYYKESGFGNFAEVYRSGFSRGYAEGYQVGSNRAG